MLESFNTDKFEYQRISPEEQQQRGILGRLVGVIADTKSATRNGRKYGLDLWKKVFDDPIMKEKIANRCVFSELGHPEDRAEIDMEKICACLAEQPKVGKDGKYLYGSASVNPSQPGYDGSEDEESGNNGGGTGGSSEPDVAIDPCVAKGEYAIFFQKPSDWAKSINCYIWKDGSGEAVGGWPGTAMTNLGNGNYKLTLKGDLTGYNFIFNAGGDNQKTGDLKGLKMSAMYNSAGTVVKTIAEGDCEAGEGAGTITPTPTPTPTPDAPSVEPGEQCVFFKAPSGWSSAYCYVWFGAGDSDDNRICGEWPGKPCENLGNGYFKYSFDKTIGDPEQWNIIFNDGQGGTKGVNQTEDLICLCTQDHQ